MAAQAYDHSQILSYHNLHHKWWHWLLIGWLQHFIEINNFPDT
jgi:3-dehydroquinate dehydratase